MLESFAQSQIVLELSPIQCVPKKGGIIVVPNQNIELIPKRIVTG